MNRRIFLSGLDWIIHALDSATRRSSPTGNHSLVVLRLAGRLNTEDVEASLQQFAAAFPVLQGRTARSWTLEPYWKIPRRCAPPVLRLAVVRCNDDQVLHNLTQFANTPFLNKNEYAAFQYLESDGEQSFLAMKFDHRLLDARGAEQFLALFGRYAAGEVELEELRESCMPICSSLLNHWKDRFLSGRSLLRATRPLADCEIAGIVESSNAGESSFLQLALNREESERFTERAYREAGFLMFLPYALFCTTKAFHALCVSLGRKGRYVIPCTVDLREPEAPRHKMFFNHCSMLFFHADPDGIDNAAETISSFKRQLYIQRKEGLSECFEKVMALMRILPVRAFDRIISRQMRHCFGSFSFASIGTGCFEEGRFCGLEVENVFHMPQVPPRTGIGFFFNRHRGRINIGVSFRRELVDADGRRKMLSVLREMAQLSGREGAGMHMH